MNVGDFIDAIAFVSFWLFLFAGTVSVMARVAYYRSHGYRQPALLRRDADMLVGFSLSFGLILLLRVLVGTNPPVVDPNSVREGGAMYIPWKLLTSLPAIYAVARFFYFERFVIERGDPSSATRDHGYPKAEDELDPRVPETSGSVMGE